MDEPTITPTTLDVLQGDRLCVRCGYNLIGQPIRKHESLKLVAAQCPECGTFAALQEYPALGRWAGRWATLLAAVWFITLCIALLISSFVIFRYAESTEAKASRRFATYIGVQQYVWVTENEVDPASILPYWNDMMLQQDVYFQQFLPDWWQQQDVNDLLADAGGWLAITDWSAAYAWFWMVLIAIPIGAFWSIALLHVKRRYLFIAAVIIVLVAACWNVLMADTLLPVFGQLIGPVAQKTVGTKFGYLTIAVAVIPLFAGMLVGRSCARLAVRLLLPPHLRSSFTFLWTAENKPPPRRAIWDQPIA